MKADAREMNASGSGTATKRCPLPLHCYNLGAALAAVFEPTPCADALTSAERQELVENRRFYDTKQTTESRLEKLYWTTRKICAWLEFGGSIQEVVSEPFYPFVGYCESADGYADDLARLHGKVGTEFARFLILWGALETAIKIAVPDKKILGKDCKVTKACVFLDSHQFATDTTSHHSQLARHFNAARLAFYGSQQASKFATGPAAGLWALYAWRNEVAHGSLDIFDSPDDDKIGPTIAVFHLGAHLALFTLQLLMSACLTESRCTIVLPVAPLDFRDAHATMVASEAFGRAHLENFGQQPCSSLRG